jgi:hypothetical protein
MRYAKRFEWFTCEADQERADAEGDQPFKARVLVNPNGADLREELMSRRALILQTITAR